MAKRLKKQGDTTLIDLVEAKEQAQNFFDKYQKIIFGAAAGIVLIFGGIFAYNNFVVKPKQAESLSQIWKAEQLFLRDDSLQSALTNPGGGFQGFVDLADTYSAVPTGNAANLYTAISYLRLGQFEAAISYLKDVDAEGEVLPILKWGAMGDAYSELSELDKALGYYKKAVASGENEALTPIYLERYAMLCEKLGKTAEAKKSYERLAADYPNTIQARAAERFLIRMEGVK